MNLQMRALEFYSTDRIPILSLILVWQCVRVPTKCSQHYNCHTSPLWTTIFKSVSQNKCLKKKKKEGEEEQKEDEEQEEEEGED